MATKTVFTIEEKEQITTLYKEGHFIKEIALHFNVWVGCIKRELREAGFKTNNKIEFSDEQIKRLLELYKVKSLGELEVIMGCKRSVITRILRDNGALIRRRGKIQKYFITNGLKTCSSCKQDKPATEFGLHSGTNDGLQPTCKECSNRISRNNSLKRKFGITESEYNSMSEAQNNLCAICGQPETRVKFGKPTKLAVDHNHRTGAIRQLICFRCNVVIGRIEENPSLCDKLKDYLLKHNGGKLIGN